MPVKEDPRNPVKIEVRFVPETGSKRPYEQWLSTAAERAAKASADKIRKLFGIEGLPI